MRSWTSLGRAKLAAQFASSSSLKFAKVRQMAKNVSHVGNKTARDRVREYPGRFYESGNLLFCKTCEVTLDHRRKSTLDLHLRGAKHVARETRPTDAVENEASGSGTAKRQVTLTSVFNENVSKRARTDLIMDVVLTFTSADIPLEKLDNPYVRSFLETHVVNGKTIPGADYLRRNKVKEVYEMQMMKIKEILQKSHTICIITDETTDAKNRAILNTVAVPVVSQSSNSFQPFLIDTVKLVSGVCGNNVAGAVLRTLAVVGIPYDRLLGFVTDNVAYMGLAFKTVNAVIPSSIHVGCWAHIFSLVGDQWRFGFPQVDKFVASMKKMFKTSRKKKKKYVEVLAMEGIEKPKAPPQPVLNRWNSWLLADQQHSEYFRAYPALITALEGGSDSQAFDVIQELLNSSYKELDLKLRFVAVLSKKICDAVDAMESREVSAHTIYNSANNLLQWLNTLALEDYEKRTRLQGFDKEAAKTMGDQFNTVITKCAKKLQKYINGKQPAIAFFKAVRVFDVLQVATLSRCITTYSAIPQLSDPDDDLKVEWNIYMDKATAPGAIDDTFKLVQFWYGMKQHTPRLAEIALSCLSVPTSSVDVERSFSVYDNVFDDKRRNLTSENMKYLTGLYFNAKVLA